MVNFMYFQVAEDTTFPKWEHLNKESIVKFEKI